MEGPAIMGMAMGTRKGSSPAASPVTPPSLGKIILMAMRNKMMPPAILTASWRKLRKLRIC